MPQLIELFRRIAGQVGTDDSHATLPGVRLSEASIRALLVRIDPLVCSSPTPGVVRVPVMDAIDAVEARGRPPIHEPIPGRAAGASRRDGRALRALAAACRAAQPADRDTRNGVDNVLTIDLAVPEPVGHWIVLRARLAERDLDTLWIAAI